MDHRRNAEAIAREQGSHNNASNNGLHHPIVDVLLRLVPSFLFFPGVGLTCQTIMVLLNISSPLFEMEHLHTHTYCGTTGAYRERSRWHWWTAYGKKNITLHREFSEFLLNYFFNFELSLCNASVSDISYTA